MTERDPNADSVPPAGRIAAPREVPGADLADARDDDPSGNDLLSNAGDDPKSWTPEQRLAKDMEGQEVDEPDPTVEERLKGA